MTPSDAPTPASDAAASRRVIKRYSNRKLYDTRESRYVTLLQVAELVRAGEDVVVLDNATKEDKTDVTLALIISEELKARPRGIPLATLRALVRSRRGRILEQLRGTSLVRRSAEQALADEEPRAASAELGAVDAPVSGLETEAALRSESEPGSSGEESPRGLRATLEQWQHAIDERIRQVLPNFWAFRELQQEIRSLQERVERLERGQGSEGGDRSRE